MTIVNMHEAKTHFSKLVDAVMQGNEIIIAKAGKPAAKLVPIIPIKTKRRPGALKGRITMAPDFNASLPKEILDQFEANQW